MTKLKYMVKLSVALGALFAGVGYEAMASEGVAGDVTAVSSTINYGELPTPQPSETSPIIPDLAALKNKLEQMHREKSAIVKEINRLSMGGFKSEIRFEIRGIRPTLGRPVRADHPVAIRIKELHQMNTKIEALEAEIATLEGNGERLDD